MRPIILTDAETEQGIWVNPAAVSFFRVQQHCWLDGDVRRVASHTRVHLGTQALWVLETPKLIMVLLTLSDRALEVAA